MDHRTENLDVSRTYRIYDYLCEGTRAHIHTLNSMRVCVMTLKKWGCVGSPSV